MRTKPTPALFPAHKKKSAGKHQLSGGFLSDSVRIRFRAALFDGFARITLFSCRFHAVRAALFGGFARITLSVRFRAALFGGFARITLSVR